MRIKLRDFTHTSTGQIRSLLQKQETLTPQNLFFELYIIFQIISFFGVFISHGALLGNIVWSGSSSAVSPDFVQSLFHAYGLQPYELNGMYPSLIYVILNIIDCFLPESIFLDPATGMINTERWVSASIKPYVRITSIVFYVVMTALLVHIIRKIMNEKGSPYTKILIWVTLTSTPYLFALERANVIICAIIAILYYCAYYDSPKPGVRMISYACLAFAFSLKLYPVVLGLLILQGAEPIKRAVKCAIAGLLFFFVPFLFTGGWFSAVHMFQNVTSHVSNMSDPEAGMRHKVGITSLLSELDAIFGVSITRPHLFSIALKLAPYAILVLGCVGFFLVKSRWKKCALLTITMVMFPGFSLQYNVLYMLAPLLLFIISDTSKQNRRMSYFYAVQFVLCFAPLAFGTPNILEGYSSEYYLNLGSIVPSAVMLLMLIMLCAEGVVELIQGQHEHGNIEAASEQIPSSIQRHILISVGTAAALAVALSVMSFGAKNMASINNRYMELIDTSKLISLYKDESTVRELRVLGTEDKKMLNYLQSKLKHKDISVVFWDAEALQTQIQTGEDVIYISTSSESAEEQTFLEENGYSSILSTDSWSAYALKNQVWDQASYLQKLIAKGTIRTSEKKAAIHDIQLLYDISQRVSEKLREVYDNGNGSSGAIDMNQTFSYSLHNLNERLKTVGVTRIKGFESFSLEALKEERYSSCTVEYYFGAVVVSIGGLRVTNYMLRTYYIDQLIQNNNLDAESVDIVSHQNGYGVYRYVDGQLVKQRNLAKMIVAWYVKKNETAVIMNITTLERCKNSPVFDELCKDHTLIDMSGGWYLWMNNAKIDSRYAQTALLYGNVTGMEDTDSDGKWWCEQTASIEVINPSSKAVEVEYSFEINPAVLIGANISVSLAGETGFTTEGNLSEEIFVTGAATLQPGKNTLIITTNLPEQENEDKSEAGKNFKLGNMQMKIVTQDE